MRGCEFPRLRGRDGRRTDVVIVAIVILIIIIPLVNVIFDSFQIGFRRICAQNVDSECGFKMWIQNVDEVANRVPKW